MFKRALITVLTALTLQGCFGVFLAGAAVGGLVVYDRRTLETMKEDHQITYQIQRRLAVNESLQKTSHIVVASFNRVVLLAGQAPTQQEKQQVLDKVKEVPNIKHVYDEIKLEGPTSPLTRSSDSWLTTKIRTAMLSTKRLRSSQIKVVSENGTVYLLGVVTRAQGKLASDVARSVSGVQRVVTLFEYNYI